MVATIEQLFNVRLYGITIKKFSETTKPFLRKVGWNVRCITIMTPYHGHEYTHYDHEDILLHDHCHDNFLVVMKLTWKV